MSLSQHFSLEELTVSQEAARRGLSNEPPPELLPALRRTAEGLERIRALLGCPIVVTSGYRSATVNALVGGAAASQHTRGEAADIIAPGFGTPAAVAQKIAGEIEALGVDQVILEFGRWVHVSFRDRPRHLALTIRSAAEGYRPGIIV